MSAKSYKCEDCLAHLRTVKELQDHGEVTGHANFSESEEAVLRMVCVECGKPCRSATEQQLHTQRTGHSEFLDKTGEAEAVDTAGDMAKLKEELMEVDDVDDKKEPEEKKEVEKVPVEVDQALLQELTSMGFGANRATRAIHFTGTSDVAQAVDWIMAHEEDADVDEPLLVTPGGAESSSSSGPPLSKEEAKAKAEELIRKAKAKKDAEERESERLREIERIRSGKELQEMRRKEQDQERERLRLWRKKEKEEEARAQARIKEKLEEDKRERRRKMGLPEDPTPEELAAKAEKDKAAAEQARIARERAEAVGKPKVKPVMAAAELRALLVQMKQSHKDENERVTKAFNTLLTYLGNIARNPAEEKFRKINLGNAAFNSRLGSMTGGIEFLMKCGFQKDASGETLFMTPEKVDMEILNTAGGEINSALTNPFFGVL